LEAPAQAVGAFFYSCRQLLANAAIAASGVAS
jgi:hypothetical protein